MLGTFHFFYTMSLRVGVNVAHWLNPCMTGRLACGRLSLQWASPEAANKGCTLPPSVRGSGAPASAQVDSVPSGSLSGASIPSSTVFTPLLRLGLLQGHRGLAGCARDEGRLVLGCTTSSDESRPRCTRGHEHAAWIAGSLVQKLARVLVMWPPSQLAWQVTMVC